MDSRAPRTSSVPGAVASALLPVPAVVVDLAGPVAEAVAALARPGPMVAGVVEADLRAAEAAVVAAGRQEEDNEIMKFS